MKAVLVIDMPMECWECDLTHENTSGLAICNLTGNALHPMGCEKARLENCPLRELPEAKSEEFGQTIINAARAEGWNACLRVISGTQDLEG